MTGDGRTVDAVVVGSGAGGAAAAWRLTERGLGVLLLEAGPRFVPDRDYPLDQPGWERRGFPVPPGSRAEVIYGDLGQIDPYGADLSAFDAAHPPQRTGGARPPSAAGYAHVMGLGGSTLHYVGEAHRLHPESFRLRQVTGAGADWPLTYADLEPYYAMAETLIGVAGPLEPGARWRSAPYPLPAHPPGPAAIRLGAAAGRLGWEWGANPRAALSRPWRDRPACNYCGQCSRGCPLGDKGSADVTFLAAAEATGRLTILTGARVIRLHPGPGGRILSLDYTLDGRIRRQETPLLFLAAGAVQTPRLLLAQTSADWPAGLANGSGQVGRNFMETLSYAAAGLAPGLRLSQRGLPADAISWQFSAPDGGPDGGEAAIGGFRLSSSVQEVGLNGPIAHATRLLDGHGKGLKAALRATFGSALSVLAVGAVIPDQRSFIGLSPDRTDADGLPLPVINSVLTRHGLDLLDTMAGAARRLLAEAGVERLLEQFSSHDAFTATHVFGTCRMGTDPAQSVTDGVGRSHDHPNLHITDASVFPSSGGGESPSLTISALALRSADAALI